MGNTNGDSLSRRAVLQMGVAAAVGAGAGFFTGRAGRFASPRWTVELQGGYGLLFRGGFINALAPSPSSCGAYSHPMILIVRAGNGLVHADTNAPVSFGPFGERWWTLEGKTRFVVGMPGKGIKPNARTPWDNLTTPFGPSNPYNANLWNDRVWLPHPQKPVADVETKAARSIMLTDGDLSVLPPTNLYGLNGRWYFNQAAPNRKALTDRIALTAPLAQRVEIETDGKKIVLTPDNDVLNLIVRHEVMPEQMCFQPGDPLLHFAMLYDFVDGIPCANAIVPKLEKREDKEMPTCKQATPGDLCPPLPLEP